MLGLCCKHLYGKERNHELHTYILYKKIIKDIHCTEITTTKPSRSHITLVQGNTTEIVPRSYIPDLQLHSCSFTKMSWKSGVHHPIRIQFAWTHNKILLFCAPPARHPPKVIFKNKISVDIRSHYHWIEKEILPNHLNVSNPFGKLSLHSEHSHLYNCAHIS